MSYLFTSESVTEGHPMKEEFLPYIKTNFEKMSQREMARRLQIGKTSVNRWSKEMGLYARKNTVNDGFFNMWTFDMAYILGYIFADGNVAWKPEKSYRALTITAAAKDVNHLEKIRIILESTKNLLYSDSTNSYRLIVNSKKLCEDLMKLGVIPRKSLVVEFPDIPKEYVCHFIRGVIDGDGCIRYNDRKRSPYFEISIASGSYKFLEKMVEIIKQNIGVSSKITNVKNNTFIIRYSCKRGLKLAEWIYYNQNLCLERKLKQYKMALEAKEVSRHE